MRSQIIAVSDLDGAWSKELGLTVDLSGAGIGLFVCARLIRAMGGRIWASPRAQGGAEFGFALSELDE